MKFTLSVKPGIDFPKNLADNIRNAILDADKVKVAEWLESLPDEHFISAFTLENRKLLSLLLRGEIKKKRGLKQERGFHDFIIFSDYKLLREQGYKRDAAISKTDDDLRGAMMLPESDMLRQAVEGRYWKDENVEENIEKIVSKLDKFVAMEITPPKSP